MSISKIAWNAYTQNANSVQGIDISRLRSVGVDKKSAGPASVDTSAPYVGGICFENEAVKVTISAAALAAKSRGE